MFFFLFKYRVQRKRFNELEKVRKVEILNKLKEEREISKEIVGTLKLSQTGGFDARQSMTSSQKMRNSSSVRFSLFYSCTDVIL
jgi:hypothetical protein